MTKRNKGERRGREKGKGGLVNEREGREEAADTQLVLFASIPGIDYVYFGSAVYTECRQVLLTPSTTPRTCTPDIRAFPTSCFPDVQTQSHTLLGIPSAIDRWHDATAVFPPLAFLTPLPPHLFRFLPYPFSSPPPTPSVLFPRLRGIRRIPFPRAMNLLSMILF